MYIYVYDNIPGKGIMNVQFHPIIFLWPIRRGPQTMFYITSSPRPLLLRWVLLAGSRWNLIRPNDPASHHSQRPVNLKVSEIINIFCLFTRSSMKLTDIFKGEVIFAKRQKTKQARKPQSYASSNQLNYWWE